LLRRSNRDADEQAAAEKQWRQQELRRQRAQAILDAWVESRRADAEEERAFRRALDPYNYGHWRGSSRSR
jgi:hypothetical protein